jgi:hypothetical protein
MKTHGRNTKELIEGGYVAAVDEPKKKREQKTAAK